MSPPSGHGRVVVALVVLLLVAVAGIAVAITTLVGDDSDDATATTAAESDEDDVRSDEDDVRATVSSEHPRTSAATSGPVTTTAAPTTAAPITAATVPTDLLSGTQAADVVAAVAAARDASPLRILSAAFYPGYAFVRVQDPAIPQHVDEYAWRDTLAEPTPVRLTGDGELEEALFSDVEVDWTAIPALVAAAPGLLEIDDGEVSHVIVDRNLPFSTEITMRVFVTSPRSGGFVDADAAGDVIDVQRG